MSAERVHRTTHEVTVAAPVGVVYGLISDAVQWPLLFPHNVHVERLEFDGERERLRMWAIANGEVKSWTSHRVLDADLHRVRFSQELPAAPVQSMGGTWIVEALDPDRSRLTVLHEFTVARDDAADLAWVERATNANSGAELERLKKCAERWAHLDDLMLSFEDSIKASGPPELIYDFLHRAGDWAESVPRVAASI